MTQPYFFAHSHLHQMCASALREAGYKAWCLAFVPRSLYLEHKSRYQAAERTGLIKVVCVRDEKAINRAVARFFLGELLAGRRALVHILRCDPDPIIRLRRLPLVARRLKLIIQHEGDQPSELVYQNAYKECPRPPEDPPSELQSAYDSLCQEQTTAARAADGLVLMSQEHVNVWMQRLGLTPNTTCLAPLLDPALGFDLAFRTKLRKVMGLEDKAVFVYIGNTICKWQRFEATCGFIGRLCGHLPSAWFLAIVRRDDLVAARETALRHGILSHATILTVESCDIPRYLSAADVALFLRHRHTMNFVVTSAKLGEYLACGLPIVTTGANAATLNDFIMGQDAGLFIPDSLEMNDHTWLGITDLIEKGSDPRWRIRMAEATANRFSGANSPLYKYVEFARAVLK
jgi:glycosyltransferase involved in cell wall biosynthesis